MFECAYTVLNWYTSGENISIPIFDKVCYQWTDTKKNKNMFHIL